MAHHAIGESLKRSLPLDDRQSKIDKMGQSTEIIEDMGVANVRRRLLSNDVNGSDRCMPFTLGIVLIIIKYQRRRRPGIKY